MKMIEKERNYISANLLSLVVVIITQLILFDSSTNLLFRLIIASFSQQLTFWGILLFKKR